MRCATEKELNGFKAIRSRCHENVDRWCRLHPGHVPVRGWLNSGGILDRHSVVDPGDGTLLDISPRRDAAQLPFLLHDTEDGPFDTLPHQVIVTRLLL